MRKIIMKIANALVKPTNGIIVFVLIADIFLYSTFQVPGNVLDSVPVAMNRLKIFNIIFAIIILAVYLVEKELKKKTSQIEENVRTLFSASDQIEVSLIRVESNRYAQILFGLKIFGKFYATINRETDTVEIKFIQGEIALPFETIKVKYFLEYYKVK